VVLFSNDDTMYVSAVALVVSVTRDVVHTDNIRSIFVLSLSLRGLIR
jgi:hypothetical protein